MMLLNVTNRRRKALFGLAFVFPWVAGFALFTLWPMLHSLFLSFNAVKLAPTGIKTEWIGTKNYRDAFMSDPVFVEKLIKFLSTTLLNVPIIIVFSLIIALLVNQKIKFKRLFRTIFFLPVVITSGPVITELMAQGATTIPSIEQYGVFQIIENNLNKALAEPVTYLFTQIIMVLWFSGVQILIILAGLQKIDTSMYEAARIDGANAWESFWKVTVPTIKPLILVNMIYTIVILSTFALNEIIMHIKNHMFNTMTGFGYANALAWIHFVVISVLLAIGAAVLNMRKS